MPNATRAVPFLLGFLLGAVLLTPGLADAAGFEIDLRLTRTEGESLLIEWFLPGEPDIASPATFNLHLWAPSRDGTLAPVFETRLPGGVREYTLPAPTAEDLLISVEARDADGTVVGTSPREPTVAGVRGIGVPEDIQPLGQAEPDPLTDQLRAGLSCDIRSLEINRFPLIYMNVNVLRDGSPAADLEAGDFEVIEDGVVQTDLLSVTPPSEGGGSRIADVVFLIDDSGSMSSEINAVRANVSTFVQHLAGEGVDFRLGLVRFGQSGGGAPQVFNGGALSAEVSQFLAWLNTFTTGGSYEPGLLAILTAAQTFHFRPGSQRIFILVTDEDSDGGSQSQLSQTVALCQSNSITVYGAVNCGDGSASWQYCGTGIVSQTGGRLFAVTGSYDSILGDIGIQVESTYVIRYRSSSPDFDGRERTVRVIVSDGAESDEDTRTYIPGAGPHIARTQPTIDLGATGQVAGAAVTIEALVTDAVPPAVQSVELYYKRIGGGAFARLVMSALGADTYRAVIPAAAVAEPGIAYYLRATDGVLSATDPSMDPADTPYHFAVLPNEPPLIEHAPPPVAVAGLPLEIAADVHDGTHYVEAVRLYYRPFGDLLYGDAAMNEGPADHYAAIIPAGAIGSEGVEYYIKATDDLGVDRTCGTADNPLHVLCSQGYVGGEVSLLRIEVSMDGGMSYESYGVRDLVSVPSESRVRFVGQARDERGVPMAGATIRIHDGHAYDAAGGASGLAEVTVAGAGQFVYPPEGIEVEGPDVLPFWFALEDISQIPYLLVISGPCGDSSCLAGRLVEAFDSGVVDQVAAVESSTFERHLFPYPPNDELDSRDNDEFFGMYFMQYFGPTNEAFLFGPDQDGWLDRGMRVFAEWSTELAVAAPQLVKDARNRAAAVALREPDGSIRVFSGAAAQALAFEIDWNVVSWGVEFALCGVGVAGAVVSGGATALLGCAPLVMHAVGDYAVKPHVNPWLCDNYFSDVDQEVCEARADLAYDGISLVVDVATSGGVAGMTKSATRTTKLGTYLANPRNLRFAGQAGRVFGRIEAVKNAVETVSFVGETAAFVDDADDVFWRSDPIGGQYVIGGVDGIVREATPGMPWESLPLAYGYGSLGEPTLSLSSGMLSLPSGPAVSILVNSSRPLYPPVCASHDVYAPHSPQTAPHMQIVGPTMCADYPLTRAGLPGYWYEATIPLSALPGYTPGEAYAGTVTIEGFDFVMNIGEDQGDCGFATCSSEPVSLRVPSGARLDLPGGSCEMGDLVTLLGTSDPAEGPTLPAPAPAAGEQAEAAVPSVPSLRVSDVWSLGDEGVRLGKPATLSLPYALEQVPTGSEADIWHWVTERNGWRPLGARKTGGGLLACEVMELGLYCVRAAPSLDLQVDLDPDALNVKSKGRSVTAYLEVPADLLEGGFDTSSVLLNALVPAQKVVFSEVAISDLSENASISVIMMKFDRESLIATLPPVNGVVSLPVVGILGGRVFRATDEIRILGNKTEVTEARDKDLAESGVGRAGVTRLSVSPGNVSLAVRLARAEQVRIQVFDLRGRLVGTLLDASLEQGVHEINWDRRDGSGRQAPSGVYFCAVRGQSFIDVRKMILVR